MIFDYENRKIAGYFNSPFDFKSQLPYFSNFSIYNSASNNFGSSWQQNSFGGNISNSFQKSTEEALNGFIKHTEENFDSVQKGIKMLALGINYRKFSLFDMMTPKISRSNDEDYWIFSQHNGNYHYSQQNTIAENSETSNEDTPEWAVKFCIDFVAETALILHDFDYTLNQET